MPICGFMGRNHLEGIVEHNKVGIIPCKHLALQEMHTKLWKGR